MALLPKEQAYIDAARKRGMSQGKIDTFLKENTGDYSRLSSQKTDAEIAAEEASRRGKPAPSVGGPVGAPSSVGPIASAPVASAPPASIAALNTATGAPAAEAPSSLPMFVPQEPAGPGIQGAQQGMLRQGMGMRQPPMPNMALAALKRVY